MKIRPKDTVADVTVKNGALFNLGFTRICEKVKGLELASHIPLMRPRRATKYIECRDVLQTITLRELDAIIDIKPTQEHFIQTLATMLKINEENVKYLQFTGAMRYYMAVLDAISAIGKKWKTIEIHEEEYYKPKHPDRGLWSVADRYRGNNSIDWAWDQRWIDVFLHFESEYDKYMAMKAEQKAKQKK